MIVMKFGGTSVGDKERIDNIIKIVRSFSSESLILVISAHSGVTDGLLDAAEKAKKGEVDLSYIKQRHFELIESLGVKKEVIEELLNELELVLKGISILKELTDRTLAYILSFGERFSVRVVSSYFCKCGIKAVPVEASELGLITDSDYLNARPLPEAEALIKKNIQYYLKQGLPIITGFIGKNKENEITTLGRGGSDFSAAVIGAAIGADEIQIWTDVDGVMTANPKVVPQALSIEKLSFAEAGELAYYGAKVLHPATILPAVKKNIPVRVKNTYKPQNRGTVILSQVEDAPNKVKSIVYKKGIVMINVVSSRMLLMHGFMAKLFDILSEHKIVIDMIATSEVSVTLTTEERNLNAVKKAVKRLNEFATTSIATNKAILCVVGQGMKHTIGLAARVFQTLAKEKINIQMISQGASEINIALLIDEDEVEKGVRALHKEFFGV